MHMSTGRIPRPAAGVALALAMVVAACNSAPGAGAPGGAPAGSAAGGSQPGGGTQPPATSVGAGGTVPAEMCPLVSGEDIAAIVDKDLAETRPGADAWCTWTFTERRPGALPGIDGTVIVRYEGDGITLDTAKSASPGGEDVSIGDRGYWTDDFSVLYVVKGAHVYAIQLILFDEAEPRLDMATQIAQLLLAKL